MSMPHIDPALIARVDRLVQESLPKAIAFRHERHRHPELTWKEHATAAAVAHSLSEIPGIKVQTGVGKLGVVGIIEGARPGPTVALRADMDALPVRECSGKTYASQTEGVMHACGHDGHMANLLGSALVLSQLRDQIAGRVKLIFQPAEEGGGGARVMADDGALHAPDVDVIFGLHGWPELALGQVYFQEGPVMASTTTISLTLRGTGCHAAMPHLGTDQILVGARIIEAAQVIASRMTAPTEPVALSFTMFHGGTAFNVIPDSVTLGGTLRALTTASRDRCMGQLRTLVESLAQAHGVKAELEFSNGYPATVNHKAPTDFLEQVGMQVLPEGTMKRMPAPSMGGEDFAFFLERVPGSYFFVGVSDGRSGGYPSLHHPAYDFNDEALPIGMKLFVHAALAWSTRPSL